MTGQMNDGRNGTNGIKYVARLRAVADGGKVTTTDNRLRVEGANAVTLLLTAGTDYRLQPPSYRGNVPEETTATELAEAAARSYPDLRSRHVADYQRLFRRVSWSNCISSSGGTCSSAAPGRAACRPISRESGRTVSRCPGTGTITAISTCR
jgi:transglutaminase-like putative cysteine protease